MMDNKHEMNHVFSSFQDFMVNRSQQELQTQVLVDKLPIKKSNKSKRQSLDTPGCFAHGHQLPSRWLRQSKKALFDFSLAVTSESNQFPVADSTSSISGWYTLSYVYILLSWYRRPSLSTWSVSRFSYLEVYLTLYLSLHVPSFQ